MDRRRKRRKSFKRDRFMYIFTFGLCLFTVVVAAWMIRDGKSAEGSRQGGGEEGFQVPGSGAEAGQKSGTGSEGFQKQGSGSEGLPESGSGSEGLPESGSGPEGLPESGSESGGFPGSEPRTEGDQTGQNYEGQAYDGGKVPGEGAGADTIAEGFGEKPEITLLMVGDILLHTPVAESGEKEDGSYDFSAIFAEIKEEIQAADLALVNQEVIIGGAELGVSGYPAFNAPYELGDALVEAGFDVVLHATNHALDKGKKGILNCLSFWQEKYPDIAVLGIHESEEGQQEIYVYEQEGIRLAILNYTYGTNGIALPQDMPYAVDLLERERIAEDLRRAQEAADFVIVCPHWGTEYVLEETAQQREWAAFFAENGADLILGTHPHVIEPVEWIGEPGSGTLVYYSLGNFVNWTSETGEGVANRMVGGLARVSVGLDDKGEAVVTSYGVEPVACHVEQGFGGVRVYPLDSYTEALAERNEIVGQDSGFSLDYCQKLVRDVFGTLVDK